MNDAEAGHNRAVARDPATARHERLGVRVHRPGAGFAFRVVTVSRECTDANGRPREQRIACSDYRALLPMWRDDPIYMELKGDNPKEGPNDYWRDRYRDAAKGNPQSTPKRLGRAWQQLRANAALLVEWIRIAFRKGWLGSARRNRHGVRSPHDCPRTAGPEEMEVAREDRLRGVHGVPSQDRAPAPLRQARG